MEPILIGYFPKRRPEPKPGLPFPTAPNVTDLASTAHYTSEGPANWVDQWRHNEMWFYDSEALCRKVAAEAIEVHVEPDPQRDPPWQVKLNRETGKIYDFYAYKVFPCCFVDGRKEDFAPTGIACEPLSADYEQLGYDAVNRTCCPHFECAPLCCNGMASEIPVNNFCLISEPDRALEVAREFSVSKPEPGTYFVLEVWRKKAPSPAPAQ